MPSLAAPARSLLSTAMLSLPLAMGALHSAQAQETSPASNAPQDARPFDLRAKPLSEALADWALQSRWQVLVQPSLVTGKSAPAVSGRMTPRAALDRLLAGSGLSAVSSGSAMVVRSTQDPAGVPAVGEGKSITQLNTVTVNGNRHRDVGPIPGLSLTKDEIPGNVQSISAEQIKAAHAISLSDLMNTELQSVNVNDYQGNPFQMDVTYRGFTASPQLGTSQGLSVFLDGIRVNEPFGDVVNWDLIPMNALAGLDLFPGSNPVFGLGTLGGALALRTKNGFDQPGVDGEILAGSFGRKQLQLSAGGSRDNLAAFVSANAFSEKGWRDNSPSQVNQAFGKLSYRKGRVELDGSVFGVSNRLIGNGLVPTELFEAHRSAVFSSPDKTKNELLQLQLAGAFKVDDVFSVTGQVYQRRSHRDSSSGDVNTEFSGQATRRAKPGESPVCAYPDANRDGIIDYYVATQNIPDGFGNLVSQFDLDLSNAQAQSASYQEALRTATAALDPTTRNAPLPTSVANYVRAANYTEQFYNSLYDPRASTNPVYLPATPSDASGSALVNYHYPSVQGNNYYIGANGLKNELISVAPLNQPCGLTNRVNDRYQLPATDYPPADRDGAHQDTRYHPATGVVDGTPVSVISEGAIKQYTRGISGQLNWNTDRHKFMVGASFDHARSSYENCQRLGLFDANRRAYLDPDQIGEEFTAAQECVRNNDFGGTNQTRSLYFSETYAPVATVHLNAAARFNQTRVANGVKVRANNATVDLNEYQNSYDLYTVCDGSSLRDCTLDQYTKPRQADINRFVFGDSIDPADPLSPTTHDAFKYRSLNPSFGATWQARADLNVYANWSQGSRTPSNIELGCAFNRTPFTMANGTVVPRGLVDGSACTLPNSLSGDPYLKQITSKTTEIGARGTIGAALQWNITAYRSDILDDIYLVGFSPTRSYFDTIPKSRRQGVEMGVSGNAGRTDFKLNYSLTDATIQSTSPLVSPYNSSAGYDASAGDFQQIMVHPGNRLPGVPLHNINLGVGYQLTQQWHVGVKAVAHSGAFVRGNENNQHEAGVSHEIVRDAPDPDNPNGFLHGRPTGLYTSPSPYPGRTPGFMVFNLKTDYRFDNGVSLLMLVNNLFDRRYFSAGRLGVNPFSPSINGAIGPGGFNYNSNDWRATNLVAPGAPRAAWFAISYELK